MFREGRFLQVLRLAELVIAALATHTEGECQWPGEHWAHMVIVTSALDPAHRIAFGTAEHARRFIVAARDPAAWLEPMAADEFLVSLILRARRSRGAGYVRTLCGQPG